MIYIDTNEQEFFYVRYLISTYILTLIVWICVYICLNSTNYKHRLRKYYLDISSDSQYDQYILHISQPNELDDTWIEEKSRVRTLERHYVPYKVLHVEEMSVFFGLKSVLKHINFMLDRFQVLSIFGANGSGKSVLIKSILGILPPSSGHVTSPNKGQNQSYNHKGYTFIGYSSQEAEMFESLTILEMIYILLKLHRFNEINLKNEALILCKAFNLFGHRFSLAAACSRGIQKLLSIAIALMSNSNLILIDDPFSYLDVINQNTIHYLIQEWCSHGHSVIYTCSDTELCSLSLQIAAISQLGLSAFGERQYLQRNFYSSYYVIETRIYIENPENVNYLNLESVSKPVRQEELDQIFILDLYNITSNKSCGIGKDTSGKFKYLKVCDLIEKIFPHAIIKNISLPKVCFWLSSHIYSMSQVLKILHEYRHNFYSYSISQPSVSTAYLQISSHSVHKKSLGYS